MTQKHTPPSGMIKVTKDQFYFALEADKRDIMPSTREEFITTWETKSGELWGWENTGWKNPSYETSRYIYPAALAKAKSDA